MTGTTARVGRHDDVLQYVNNGRSVWNGGEVPVGNELWRTADRRIIYFETSAL